MFKFLVQGYMERFFTQLALDSNQQPYGYWPNVLNRYATCCTRTQTHAHTPLWVNLALLVPEVPTHYKCNYLPLTASCNASSRIHIQANSPVRQVLWFAACPAVTQADREVLAVRGTKGQVISLLKPCLFLPPRFARSSRAELSHSKSRYCVGLEFI